MTRLPTTDDSFCRSLCSPSPLAARWSRIDRHAEVRAVAAAELAPAARSGRSPPRRRGGASRAAARASRARGTPPFSTSVRANSRRWSKNCGCSASSGAISRAMKSSSRARRSSSSSGTAGSTAPDDDSWDVVRRRRAPARGPAPPAPPSRSTLSTRCPSSETFGQEPVEPAAAATTRGRRAASPRRARSTSRTMSTSMRIARPRPRPIIFPMTSGWVTNARNTAAMIRPANSTTLPIRAMPWMTLSRGPVALVVGLVDPREQEDVVVHAQPEQDREEHHRDERDDRHAAVDADAGSRRCPPGRPRRPRRRPRRPTAG